MLSQDEEIEYLRRVVRSLENVVVRLRSERDTPQMGKNECKRLLLMFDELVKERNEMETMLQIAQNTVTSLRNRNATLEEVCRHFNVSYPQGVVKYSPFSDII